ncbi:WSC domain-containing protein [Colletotrichum orbiculare MAFF 240422]|uniref:WSC domain-containing protein n=1 Tax=Colletotrichum orbiculare (strain 104-T / ATCC 96160 / CBS 514.97 / LARS 414 / MAFF 240422) TaxID=1213857 RepID=A0A484FBH4_COLOR|nr:WSC domain-containing protein [Colletotrichum orbiculare MAFF 240422]
MEECLWSRQSLILRFAGSLGAAITLFLFTQVTVAVPFNGQTRAVSKPAVSGYTYQGCYVEPSNGRALDIVHADDQMTLELCASICSLADKAYFGVEYGRECWCGSKLAAGALPAAAESECGFSCPGNPDETCGAGWRLSVYKDESMPAAQGPAAKPQVGNYVSLGCYGDLVQNQRALSRWTADDALTPEKCAAFCAGSTYMGLEYGKECWCGNTLGALSKAVASQEDCNMPCAGTPTNFCGGPARLNLYSLTPSIPASVSTSASASASGTSSAPATAASAAANRVGDFAHQGCWTDDRVANGRTLPDLLASDGMTVEKCAAWAVSKGYAYFGLEYARECWGGNALNAASVSADSAGCNMRCKGDGSESCGGPDRLDLYSYSPVPSAASSVVSSTASSAASSAASSGGSVSSTSSDSVSLTLSDHSSSTLSSAGSSTSSDLLSSASSASSSVSSDFFSSTSSESISPTSSGASSTPSTADSPPGDDPLPQASKAQLTAASLGQNALREEEDGKTVIALTPPVNGEASVSVPPTMPADTEPADSVVVQLTYKTPAVKKRAVLSECTLTMSVGDTVIYSSRIWSTDGSYTTVTSVPTSANTLSLLKIVQYCPSTSVQIVIGDVAVGPTPASSSSSGTPSVLVTSSTITTTSAVPMNSVSSPTVTTTSETISTSQFVTVANVPATSTPGPSITAPAALTFAAPAYDNAACSFGTPPNCFLSGAPVATSGLLAVATGLTGLSGTDISIKQCAQACKVVPGCTAFALEQGVAQKCYIYSGSARAYWTTFDAAYRSITYFGAECYNCRAASTTLNLSPPSTASGSVVARTSSTTASVTPVVGSSSSAASSTASSKQPSSTPSSSTNPGRSGITPGPDVPKLAVPLSVTESNCPYPTAAAWYEAGCTLSGAPLQTSGLVAVATGIPATPSGASTNQPFEHAYQACAQMCAAMTTCYSWALDRGYWPADYADWTCYFYSAGARLMTPQNQGEYWIVWMDKKCYDCRQPASALLPATPLSSLSSPVSSVTSTSYSIPTTSTSVTIPTIPAPSPSPSPTPTSPPSEPSAFSAPAYTPGACVSQPNDGSTVCALSGWPTPTSASGLLAVATGVAPVPSGVFDFSRPFQVCAGACASVGGCNTWAVDRGNWPLDLSPWSCYLYHFVNASRYALPGNYFRATLPGSAFNRFAWSVTDCYNCSMAPGVPSSGSVTLFSSTLSVSIPSSTSSTTITTSSSTPPPSTVTTFSAPPLLTPCSPPTAVSFYTNGCAQSGYAATPTGGLLAVATGIAPNAAGDFNFDPSYQRCGSICAGIGGCRGYALDRGNSSGWTCNFYSLPVRSYLDGMTPSAAYRAVVWMSLQCYNCPVPAPWPAPASSVSSVSSSGVASSATASLSGPGWMYPQSTSSLPTGSSAPAAQATCTRTAAPPTGASCNVKGFRQPAGEGRSARVLSQANCAAYCFTLGAACGSFAWIPATGWCGVYADDVWTAVGDEAVAGRAYREYAMDEPGCWGCPEGVAVRYLPG